MTTFILVRHGESMANKTKSYAGHIDIPLSEEGFLQAEAVSRYIEENFKVDAVYSSDLSRAYNTIKPFADKCNLAIEKRKELREVNVGLLQGMSFDDVEKEYPDLFIKIKEKPDLFRYPEGESYRDVAKRGLEIFKEMAKKNPGKTVLVASHNGFLRTSLCTLTGLALSELETVTGFPNASVTVLNYEGGKAEVLIKGFAGYLENISRKNVDG